MNDDYPVQFSVAYGDGSRNRLTTLFRWILIIPIAIVMALSGGLLLAPFLTIIFRKKYPRWMFDYQLELTRFQARVTAYMLLLVGEYPSTDEGQSVSLDIEYPDGELNQLLPIVKWILAIPHFIIVVILSMIAFLLVAIAWIAIIITGKFPQVLFNFVVGTLRWSYRVNAYALLLTTDRYPPFRMGS